MERLARRHLNIKATQRGGSLVNVLIAFAPDSTRRIWLVMSFVLAAGGVPIRHHDALEIHLALQVLLENVGVGAGIGCFTAAKTSGALDEIVRTHDGR